jgi:Poly(hydroxyalcanoate) granule associated protein (phasin)
VSAARAAALETLVRRARLAGHQLWLAGLGAAALAADGAPRLAARGRRLVDRLAEKGQPLAERQAARVTRLGDRLESLSGRAGRTVRGAGTLLRETAEYETRRLLERLDLATVEDLRQLAAHLETLDKKLEDYGRRVASP